MIKKNLTKKAVCVVRVRTYMRGSLGRATAKTGCLKRDEVQNDERDYKSQSENVTKILIEIY